MHIQRSNPETEVIFENHPKTVVAFVDTIEETSMMGRKKQKKILHAHLPCNSTAQTDQDNNSAFENETKK